MREHDVNGYVLIRDNPVTKVGIYPYLGSEIGADNPTKVYRVYRPAEELQRKETLDSFNLLPFINDHTFLGEGGTPAEKVGVQGTTGEAAVFDAPYVRNSLKIYSEFLKEQIEGGKVELSPSYRCSYDFTPGTFDGEAYDAVQRDIIGNHLALVDKGRTGPDVKVLDSYKISFDSMEIIMNFSDAQIEQIKELIASAIAEAAPQAPVPAVEEVAEEVAEVAAETVAEEVTDETVTEEVTDEPPAEEEKISADSIRAEIMQGIVKRDALIKRLTPAIGVFDSSKFFTEQDVAAYAVKKLGIACDSGSELATLNGYLIGAGKQSKATADKAASEITTPADIAKKLWRVK